MNSQFYKFASSLQEKLKIHVECFVKVHKSLRKFRNIYLSDIYFYILSEEKVKYKLSLQKIQKLIVSNNSAEIVLVSDGKSVLIDQLNFRSVLMREVNIGNPNLQTIFVKEPLLDEYVEGKKEDMKQEETILNLLALRDEYSDYNQNASKKHFDDIFKIQQCIYKAENYSILIVTQTKAKEEGRKKKKIKTEQPRKFTVKIYPKQLLGKNKLLAKEIVNEKKYLEQIMSLYVPTLYKCMISKTYAYCITEYYRGQTLESYLTNQTLNKQSLKLLLAQIVIAIGQLHECNLIYNNINSKGIFITEKGFVLLNDFSQCQATDQNNEQLFQKQIKFDNNKMKSETSLNSDWTAFGKLIYFIKQGKQWEPGTIISEYKEKDLSNLSRGLLQNDRQQRLGFRNDYHQILGHYYFRGLNSKELATHSCEPLKKFFKVNYSNFSKDDFSTFLQRQDWSQYDEYLKEYQYSRQLQD